jgi:hypothetical protein
VLRGSIKGSFGGTLNEKRSILVALVEYVSKRPPSDIICVLGIAAEKIVEHDNAARMESV